MRNQLQILAVVLALASAPANGQQIFKCKDETGSVSFQQIPCAKEAHTQDVRTVSPALNSPPARRLPTTYREPARPAQQHESYSQTETRAVAQPAPSGYVRCVRPDGGSYIHRGYSCPERREAVQHRAGMVLDVTTGRQHFMVPGGGNGMIDPQTGTRHELISPRPTRRVQDTAEAISADQACAEARAERDRRMSNRNRTYDSIRAAEARYKTLCGR